MNCAEFRNLVPELARDAASGDAMVTEALEHAESCRDCDAILREGEQLTAGLRALAAEHNFDAAPPRVEAALLNTLRQRQSPKPYFLRPKGWLAVSAAGIAAAAFFAILLTGYRPGSSPSPAESGPRQTNRPIIPPRAVWADYTVDGETEEQAAAAYIPLSSDFDPSWLEGGAIVRVVLSRPALERLGVPIIAGSDGQMVADMVITNDGTPEAIRVVDWQVSGIQ